MPTSRLLDIADRLAKVEAGSAAADTAIQAPIGRVGSVLPYTLAETAARCLLPDGFEWMDPTHSGSTVYAACRRSGAGSNGFPHLHHGQWGQTLPLAMCGAVVLAYTGLAKG